MSKSVLELLHRMDLFAELSDAELGKIARVLKEQRFAENDLIFAEGEVGDALYVVLQGRVRIATTDHFGRERVLAFYGPGQFFGDMAVLTGAPRSASASASTDVRLLQLRKDDFDVLVTSNPGIMRGMLRTMIERQAALNTRLSQESGGAGGDLRGLLTVVFSPRGGAGQTVLATNLAVALAALSPDRVVAVDLDVLFGHMAMLLDVVPRTALAAITPAAIRALDRDSTAFYLTQHGESSLRILAGSLRPEESELVTGEHVRAMLELLRRQYVHVVVDAGSRFSESCLAALELADEVLVVCSPDPVARTGIRETRRVLHELLGCAPEHTTYVINHALPYGRLDPAELRGPLQTERVHAIPYGGEEVSRAALGGTPLVISRPTNPTSKAITDLAHHLDRRGREALALAS